MAFDYNPYEFLPELPTFTLAGTLLEWTPATATLTYDEGGVPVTCVSSGIAAPPGQVSPAPENASCAP